MLAATLALAMRGGPPLKGDHLAPFAMKEPSGTIVQWKPGKVTVLCAFAYWCDTWKTQRVRLIESRKKLVGLPVDFLGVSVDGHWLEVDRKADWSRRLIDVGSRWSTAHGIDRVPYTLVIDGSGTVVWTGYGISRSDDIVRAVRSAFADPSDENGTVYLTFDDFPAKKGNAELLDMLRREHVQASFFVIGQDAVADPKWIRRAKEEGHGLEVHGWSHTTTGSDPSRCRTWLEQQIGKKPRWLRGPGSSVVQDFDGVALKLNEIDPYDFLRPGVGELERRVMGKLKPGSILHLHAGVADSVAALPDIIRRGKAMGLTFARLPD